MQSTTASTPRRPQTRRPVVLVVDDEPDVLELARDVLTGHCEAHVLQAGSVREARRLLDQHDVSLLVTDSRLPDGDGVLLLQHLREKHPRVGTLVITGYATLEQSLACFRCGAIDYLPKPFSAATLSDRVARALRFQQGATHTARRLKRLRSAVKKLNNARKLVSKKVDLLCNDLVSAYGDLARQFEDVRIRENFRKTITTARDLEQMLCHTMDWILRAAGYTNIAIFLSADDGVFDLGAYMKYTTPGSKMLTDAINQGCVQVALREDFFCWTESEARQLLGPQEIDHIGGSCVQAVNCTYLGESLAAIVMFREGKSPFSAEDQAMLRTIAPVFAHALTSIARTAEDGEDDSPGDPDGGGPWPDDPGGQKRRGRRRDKRDDADWWKHGESPPF